MRDWICHDAGPGKTFAAFNCPALGDETISDADLQAVMINRSSREASEAWSANCDWYFVVVEAGIVLARPGDDHGVMCLKKTWKFLEAFIDAPFSGGRKR
jgi:hypothetical protein